MKIIMCKLLILTALLFSGLSAEAAISCSISSPGFFSVYDGMAVTDNLNQSTYTINCTRLTTDPTTLNYISFNDNGLYNTGASNRAKLSAGTAYLNYNFFTTSSYASNWSTSGNCIAGTVNFGSSLSGSQTQTYYAKIPASQMSLSSGTYIDTVTASIAYNQTACQNNASKDVSTTFQVQINNTTSCQIAIAPGEVAFSYTAFTASAATASTSFSARCSTATPYTMALDTTVGVVSGLNYSLVLSAPSGTGNGALQNYSINGSMAAGQAGTCASSTCTASNQHVLTITY